MGLFNFIMKKINFTTTYHTLLADIHTPVGIYLRVRDRFRDTILLESTDFHVAENSYSIIGINAIAGFEITNSEIGEKKFPGQNFEKIAFQKGAGIAVLLNEFMNRFEPGSTVPNPVHIAQGLFGYTSYDAIPLLEKITFLPQDKLPEDPLPLVRYRLYQYVIIINHHKDEMTVCENHFQGIESELGNVISLIRSKDVPVFPFKRSGEESANMDGEDYKKMVETGIAACHRGDVFQVVLSRRFFQGFKGDDFNVYRALRSINPSPYLFYFDYGDYKLMGSSPESQVIVKNNKVTVHPIAGTFKRSGEDEIDKKLAIDLENDSKENAEHVMLVDLARNDLSRVCSNVEVASFRKVQFYSHVIHLVSEVGGNAMEGINSYDILSSTFPAGTLSGAPKFKAMQIIDENEKSMRSFYGGTIGYLGFNGEVNHAIMIRTFLSRNNVLISQAGAGVVAASKPENELQEVNNKLGALKAAILIAEKII